jgi:hypothetical protein
VRGLILNGDEGAQLEGPHNLTLHFAHHYRIVEAAGPLGPYKVSSAAYFYEVRSADGVRVLAYHWHPEVDLKWPHLHVGEAASLAGFAERKGGYSLPTGRVSIEEVVRLLIEQFEVPPHKYIWEDILSGSQANFEDYATWTTSKRAPG